MTGNKLKRRIVSTVLACICSLPGVAAAASLQEVERWLLARNWVEAKSAILQLPEGTLEQTRLKIMLLIQGKLHLDYMEGADSFRMIAGVPQHAEHAANFYRQDLRYRGELAADVLRMLPQVAAQQLKMREAVGLALESLPNSSAAKQKRQAILNPAHQ